MIKMLTDKETLKALNEENRKLVEKQMKKMKSNWNLSEKIIEKSRVHDFYDTLIVSDVKKFIKLLKEELKVWAKYHRIHGQKVFLFNKKIDTLAGEKLK